MGFFMQTQQFTTGGSPLVFAYGEQGGLGSWMYGITSFSLSSSEDTLGFGGIKVSISVETDNQSGTITLTPSVMYGDQTLPFDPYEGEVSATLSITVLAWVDPNASSTNPAVTPTSVMLAMANTTGAITSQAPDTSGYGIQGIARVNAGVLAGFALSLAPTTEQSSLYGIGAAAGAAMTPYSTSTQAFPVASAQVISGDNDDYSGVSNEYSAANTVDIGLIALSTTATEVLPGFVTSIMAPNGTVTPALPAAWQSIPLTQVGVFVQSYYLQFRITGDDQEDGPLFDSMEFGASGVTLGASGGFSFTSTLSLVGVNEDHSTAQIDAASYGVTYLYLALAGPIVTAVSPSSGPLAGGGTVTISGQNLTNVEMVRFGGMPATNVSMNGDGTVTATVPAGAATGAVDVRVLTTSGISAVVTADQYTYTS
ncbi:Hypothetical protein A7982_04980 [Minicystis rosea]|nr:Hypothetical protein A7982_04980 [Minicystis rosea]